VAGRAVLLGCEAVFGMKKIDEECNSQECKEKDDVEAYSLRVCHLPLIDPIKYKEYRILARMSN
jgi:hypothetical protein